jgi:tetratricopeptide (TPR) repeat protein
VNRRKAFICAGLVLCCAAIYGRTLTHEFVNYDDGLYVTANPHVMAGLSWGNALWAFTTERAMYVHPLTWMSHMLDCDLYGLRPWGHHLTNIVFHALCSVLLFLVLARMTGRTWPGALAAALFAVHPLHVESVAWIAERKDVLSMLFWTAGMGAYAWHRRRPSLGRYSAVSALFLLGFMSKPMVVTFPFVLLLLDYWPLGRVDSTMPVGAMARGTARLVVEKIPLFLMTAAMCAVTVIMQMRGENLGFGAKVPLLDRCANAVVVYVIYLVKTVWPFGLTVYYPHPLSRPLWQIAGASVVLAAITLLCLYNARRRPRLIVGWFWYLGTLVPVIELVQAGSFSHADRYTYIPLIGIFIMVAWELDEFRLSRRFPAAVVTGAAAVMVAGFTLAAAHQTGFWKNSETLFRHALAVTADNALARNNLGVALFDRGNRDAAREQYNRAVQLDPAYSNSINNLGVLLFDEGKYEESAQKHLEALAVSPKSPSAHANLADALARLGRYEEAESHYAESVKRAPESTRSLCSLGDYWVARGNPNKALDAFEQALKMNPNCQEANFSLAEMLAKNGKVGEAILCYRKILRFNPNHANAHNNLANLLAGQGSMEEAFREYHRALAINPAHRNAHLNLANLFMKAGRNDEALPHLRRVLETDPANKPAHEMISEIESSAAPPLAPRP